MTITFADGTRIEVAASALDDFVQHDLKWVEFVHGSVSAKQSSGNSRSCDSHRSSIPSPKENVHRCPSGNC
jgi:hypothetical protein